MIEQAVDDVPIEYRDKFQGFLDEAAVPVDGLQRQMEQYLATVRMVAPLVKAFNLDTMEELGLSALALLAHAQTEEQRRLAQAAVRYLVEEEEDDEITGVLGLDDDIQVVNAVARAFGRQDLVVVTRRKAKRPI